MRRIGFAFALIAALTPAVYACGGEEPPPAAPPPPAPPPPPPPATTPPPEPPPPPKSMAEMQKEAIADALKGLNGQDPKKFAAVYADNGVISVAGLNEVNGRAAVEQNMTEWFETFKDVKLGFSRVWVKGETLVLEWVINGKHHGELFGVKGTEQQIGHYGLSVVTMNSEGKVASEHRYGELGTVMTQIGGAGAKAKPRPIPAIPAAPETIMSTSTPDEEKNAEVAKNVLGALEAGKKEADFTGLLADDVEQDGLFHLEMSKGKDGAKKFHKSFTTAFPDAKFEVQKTIAVADYAIVESVLKGTHKGALGTIQPTKRPIALHLVDIFKIKDGKVAKAWTYQNSLEMQQQLGLFNVATAGTVPASQKPAATPASAPPKPATGGGGGTGGGTGGGGGGGKDTGGGGGKGTGGGGGGGGKK
ncbi:MAG: ester cyclase [Labilithrix sp.]|nr:ester cyclase [Labilithrix sp.]MCW5818000.1 ester cyclase [Labilithrix sp.]